MAMDELHLSPSYILVDVSNGIENHMVVYDSPAKNEPPFFTYVKSNIPGEGCDISQFTELYDGCSCKEDCTPESCSCMKQFGCAYTRDGRLEETFLTIQVSRPILECGSHCACAKLCRNRIVQKGVNRTYVVFHTDGKGLGLKTHSGSSPIPCLDFVCEYAGEVVGEEEARKRVKENEMLKKDNYLIALREHVKDRVLCTYVDPSRLGNLGRFINHSCDPNLIMLPVRVNHQVPRLALFARRVIQPDEELTFDYGGKALFCQPTSNNCNSNSVVSLGTKRKVESDNDYKIIHNVDTPVRKKFNTLCSIKKSVNESPLIPEEDIKNKKSITSESLSLVCHNTVNFDIASNCVEEKRKLFGIEGECLETDHKEVVNRKYDEKLCKCNSSNCSGFLPFDEKLLMN